jgi:riboflavin biosynthesis pyrimidine reductase
MRALLPVESVVSMREAGVDLHDWYGREWSDDGGLRLVMIASIDGAASVAGASAGLQTPGDNRVFAVLRDLCDVILVASGTAQAEGYEPDVPSAARQELRHSLGYPRIPRIAVVTRSVDLDPGSPLIRAAPPQARTLVITHAASDPAKRDALASAGAEIVIAGDREVDLNAARKSLLDRGLRRIACEGGPHLLASVLAAGAADELCMTVSPKVVGPGPGRISAGTQWPGTPIGATLTALLEEDGALFARYRLV